MAIVDTPSYGPEVLKAIAQAFDEAWANIAGNFGGEARAAETARSKLAEALLLAAREGNRDPEALKAAALERLCGAYRRAQ
jgi:hypothetical protein